MSASHYPTTHLKTSNNYVFVSDSGHTYTVYFDLKTGIFPQEDIDPYAIYMGFTCYPKQEVFSREYDSKIGATIMFIMANVFKNNQRAIITYVCSPEDGQARQRSIAFSKWFNASPLKEKINHLKNNIQGSYYGTFYSKKHPFIYEIEEAFSDFTTSDKFGSTGMVEEEAEEYLFYEEE